MTAPTDALRDPAGFTTGRRRRAIDGMQRCNIVVAGKTGVGKSTLINAVFGEHLARTGVGEPVTEHFQAYTVPRTPVGIVDSRGIELNDDLAAVLDELDGEIDRRLRRDESDHLHVLWYCVSGEGARFEPGAEGDLVRRVADRLPTVIVLTKSYDADEPSIRELAAFIESLRLPLTGVVPVLAEPRYGMEPHGLEHLIRLTEEIVPEGVRRAFLNAQIVEVDAKLDEALACVDAIVEEHDVRWQPLAFLRTTVGRGASGEDLFVQRVLDAIARVSAVFGAATVTDARVSTVARAVLDNEVGEDGLAGFLRLVNRALLLVPPVGPSAPVRVGGKLVTALAAAVAENHADYRARIRARLLSRIFARAAAHVFADVARADIRGEPLADEEIGERFVQYVDRESATAAES
jgi:GTPase SAR1 family protein